ncbi:MAG: tripartite tricarboxylate transporter permease [Alphaproteobacteria bacterium]
MTSATLVVGLVIGILFGVLPGMGPVLGVALAIPFTFHLPPVPSIALLIGIYQGGNYGGAITAAVLGIPGTPMAAATLLDAHPMALKGEASEAVTLASVSSFFGTTFSAIVLIMVAPTLAEFALRFGPAETFSLALLGLTAIASLGQGSTLKGLVAGAFGLAVATIGNDPITGLMRFNFGLTELQGGIGIVPMMMGIFAVSELLMQVEAPLRAWQASERIGVRFREFRSLSRRFPGHLRASTIGVVIGAIPAVGAVASSFLAYKLAKDFSSHPETFGKGERDGVVASEAANSATTGGAMIPMLALGIPGDPVVAIMMGGLLIQGLTAGPSLFFTNIEVLTGIFAAFLVGAILLLPIGLAAISAFLRVLRTPFPLLLAGVLVLCVIGTFLVQRFVVDLWQLWLFGVIGYGMRKTGYSVAAASIGFVLGPVLEVNLRRATIIMSDDFVGYILGRPIAITILVLVALALAFPVVQGVVLDRRKNAAGARRPS